MSKSYSIIYTPNTGFFIVSAVLPWPQHFLPGIASPKILALELLTPDLVLVKQVLGTRRNTESLVGLKSDSRVWGVEMTNPSAISMGGKESEMAQGIGFLFVCLVFV